MSALHEKLDYNRPPIFVGAGVIKSPEVIAAYAVIPELAAQVIGDFSINENGGADPTGTKRTFYWDALTQSAFNAIGLQNPGIKIADGYLRESIKRVQGAGQLAIVGLTTLRGEDPRQYWPDLAEWALGTGADGIELNGSCPNEKDGIFCTNTELTGEALEATRQRVGDDAYITMKVSSLPTATIYRYVDNAYPVNAIATMNSLASMSPIEAGTGSPYIQVNNGRAGMSGPAICHQSRKNLQDWRSAFNPLEERDGDGHDIWSIGGVDSGRGVFERTHNLGAFLVGGAQVFYRAMQAKKDPAKIIKQWAFEYQLAASKVGAASGNLYN